MIDRPNTFARALRLKFLALCAALLMPGLALAQSSQPEVGATVVTEHARATLLLSRDRVQPGDTLWAALKLELDPGWHTYWRNPGDSGLPGLITWTLPEGVTAGEIAWPAPARIPYGPLMNFGYKDLVLLPVPITIPQSITGPQTLTIDAAGDWLVCADICIPDSGVFRVSLTVDPSNPAIPSAVAGEIETVLANTPKTAPWPVTLNRSGGNIVVTAGPAVEASSAAQISYFPFDTGLIDNATPQQVSLSAGELKITVAAAAVPLDMPAQTGGLIVMNDAGEQRSFTFTAPAPAPAATASTAPSNLAMSSAADVGLWAAVVFAFLGGIILNLMPCVLPVLAMKAFAFASHTDNAAERRRDGLAYTLGVMVTFGALAAVLIGLQSAGSEIGWGFQLQSPAFVTVTAYILLVLGLNLSGVFAIGGGIMGVGQGLTQRGGAVGAFFTGTLAVIVATPCTAPFMGAAVGYAMTQPPAVTLLVFESLALGLAAPFLLLSLVPQAAKLLPRPGAWMDRLKQILAFPMYGSAAWLVWVISQQVGPEGFAAALAGVVFIALAAWLLGLSQNANRWGASAVFAGIALIATVALINMVAQAPAAGMAANTPNSATSEAYSPERVSALRAEGRPVFVNFTAAWCITCLMNERVALSSDDVKKALADNKVVYLKADWTNRDPAIAQTLASFGRSGVPLYVYYGANGAEPVVLPQLLTAGLVTQAITAQ